MPKAMVEGLKEQKMPKKPILSYKNIRQNARYLRKNMTKEEKHLWYDFLSTFKPRFQKQRAIGEYIADFYCHQEKLVIEIDGSQHYEEEFIAYDDSRSNYFSSLGIRTIRFSNREINKEFQAVCECIRNEVNK